MATSKPIRYVNDGEPLDEKTLNRSSQDVKSNLDDIYSRVDGYDEGTTEAISDRVVLRDNNATSKFGVPSDDQHPWRLNEFREFMFQYFEEDDRSNIDPKKILNYDHLPKATSSTPGITKLIQSYTSTDENNAPSADALGDFYRWLVNGGSPSGEVHRDRLPSASTSSSGIVQLVNSCNSSSLTKAPTAAAVKNCIDQVNSSIPSEDEIGGPEMFSWDDIKSGAGIEIGALENDQAASARAVREIYEAVFLGDSRLSYNSPPPGWNFDNGWVTGHMYKILPSHAPMTSTDEPGSDFPFIIYAGAGVTDVNGKIEVNFPVTFQGRRVAHVVSEANAAGWERGGNVVEPTLYGVSYDSSTTQQKTNATIHGCRIHSDGVSRYGPGLQCAWIFFGY